MPDTITGYSASDSKDKSRRYVRLHVLSEVDTSYGDGAGQLTREVDAEPAIERDLRGASFPLEADLDFRMTSIRTDYGNKTGLLCTAFKPVRKASPAAS